MRKRLAAVVGGVVVAGGALLAGLSLGRDVAGPTATDARAAPEAVEDLVEFRDAATGFELSYPRSWRRLEAADPQVRFAATPNGADSFLVRVIDLDEPVTAAEVPAFERLTYDLVTASEGVELLSEPRRIELAGLPGYFYFYAFDDASGRRGAHSHYFLFRGSDLITIVFQALPASRFTELAPIFDAIAASFEASAAP